MNRYQFLYIPWFGRVDHCDRNEGYEGKREGNEEEDIGMVTSWQKEFKKEGIKVVRIGTECHNLKLVRCGVLSIKHVNNQTREAVNQRSYTIYAGRVGGETQIQFFASKKGNDNDILLIEDFNDDPLFLKFFNIEQRPFLIYHVDMYLR